MAVITVDSVQSGSQTIASSDGTTINITISSVTTSRSIVMYTTHNSDNEARLKRHIFNAALTSSTNLQLTRHESSFAKSVTVEWTVIEFATGVLNNLQTGTVVRTNADEDTTITSVDTSKTFIIPHLKTNQNSISPSVACLTRLTSSTNMRMSSATAPTTGQSVVGYQVVEFASDADVTVQGGVLTIGSSSESATTTITSVDTSKAFVINSGVSMNQSTSPTSRIPCRLKLTNATTLQADRSTDGTVSAANVGYFVVELSGGGHAAESFDVTITNTNTAPWTQPSWAALSTSNSAMMNGWCIGNNRAANSSTSLTPNNNMMSVSLDATADGATVTRGGSTSEIYLTGYAVDFSGGGSTTYTVTGSLAAVLQKQGLTKTATLHAILKKQGLTLSSSIDAMLLKVVALTSDVDAILQKQDVTKAATLAAVLQKQGVTGATTVSAVLQNQGVGVSSVLDAILQANPTISADLSALLQKTISLTGVIDAILQKTVTAGVSLDAILTSAGSGLTSATLDAILRKTAALSGTLDALLQRQGNTATATLNALLLKQQTKTATLNAILFGSATIAASLDSLLKKSGLTITASLGAILTVSGAFVAPKNIRYVMGDDRVIEIAADDRIIEVD